MSDLTRRKRYYDVIVGDVDVASAGLTMGHSWNVDH